MGSPTCSRAARQSASPTANWRQTLGRSEVDGATTVKPHLALERHTGRSATRSRVGTASEVRFNQNALHNRQTHASKTLGLLAVVINVGGSIVRFLLHTACTAQLTVIHRPILQGSFSAGCVPPPVAGQSRNATVAETLSSAHAVRRSRHAHRRHSHHGHHPRRRSLPDRRRFP